MAATFRLEFNEQQQQYNENHGKHEPESFGWVTIVESCTDKEARLIKYYVETIQPNNVTLRVVQRAAKTVRTILDKLATWGIVLDGDVPVKAVDTATIETTEDTANGTTAKNA